MNKKKDKKLTSRIRRLSKEISILSLIALLIGQLGSIYWVFDLFSHFTWVYIIGLSLGVFAFKKIPIKLLFGLAICFLLYVSIPPTYDVKHKSPETNNTISLISYNLDINNPEKIKEIMKLETEMLNPNLVLFMSEYSSEWDDLFKRKYQGLYRCGKVEDSPFGLALYSTLDLDFCEVMYPIQDLKLFPYIRAQYKDIVIYGIHPPPPVNAELASIRDQSLSSIAKRISAEKTDNLIVMGDFNISPYSPIFRDFFEVARIYETKHRLIPTWMLGLINIDHILLRSPQNMSEDDHYIGWWRGSDHRPLFMDYQY